MCAHSFVCMTSCDCDRRIHTCVCVCVSMHYTCVLLSLPAPAPRRPDCDELHLISLPLHLYRHHRDVRNERGTMQDASHPLLCVCARGCVSCVLSGRCCAHSCRKAEHGGLGWLGEAEQDRFDCPPGTVLFTPLTHSYPRSSLCPLLTPCTCCAC